MKHKCKCCEEGIEATKHWEEDCLKKYGWYAHYVQEANNAHTHGIWENFFHRDFQSVLPLDPKICHKIFGHLANLVKEGKRFTPNVFVDDVIKNYKVNFIEVEEGNRKVLRIIFPDPNGDLRREQMDPKYAVQYD